MTNDRWKQLEDAGKGITADEAEAGWHWCGSWDGLLVGPGEAEAVSCHCGIDAIETWKRTPEAIEILNREPRTF